MNQQLQQLRKSIISSITSLLPFNEQVYIDAHIIYCAGIKYINPSGRIGTYEPFNGQIVPATLEEMPTDSLEELLVFIQQKFHKKIVRIQMEHE